MNINKITQKMYINYFTESHCCNYSEFIQNKLKSIESKCECIINCYMLFTFEDWIQISLYEFFSELVMQYPHLSVYKVICESYYDLKQQIVFSYNYSSNTIEDKIDQLEQKFNISYKMV